MFAKTLEGMMSWKKTGQFFRVFGGERSEKNLDIKTSLHLFHLFMIPGSKHGCFSPDDPSSFVGVSKNRGGPPKWMVKIMENLIC